jgi:hypothetical protein
MRPKGDTMGRTHRLRCTAGKPIGNYNGSVAKFLTIEGGRSLDTLMLRAPQTAGML